MKFPESVLIKDGKRFRTTSLGLVYCPDYHLSFLLLVLVRKRTPFTEFRNVDEMEGPGKLMKMK